MGLGAGSGLSLAQALGRLQKISLLKSMSNAYLIGLDNADFIVVIVLEAKPLLCKCLKNETQKSVEMEDGLLVHTYAIHFFQTD